MGEADPRSVSPTPKPGAAGSAPGDDARLEVTRDLGPDPARSVMPSVLPSIMPGDLSAAAGTSELRDPLLAALAAAPTPPPAPSELDPGTRVGETFRIERRLGSGGMGVVYLARDESLDRLVAVKLHRAGAGVDRLQREAMAMARLTHPNVITVHEVGRLGDRVFVAMEFVPGGTLRSWVKTRPRPWREILAVCLAAGDGLAAAHDAGLVHRDFKPENVLVGDDGRARVGDFGLARAVGESSSEGIAMELRARGSGDGSSSQVLTIDGREAGRVAVGVPEPIDAQAETLDASSPSPSPSSGTRATPRGALSDRLTMTGVLVGTPAYMSPEQFAGADVDAKADQFAFAVMTWEALYGKRPFSGTTAEKLRAAVEAGRVAAPPRDTEVPARVRAILARALAVSPAERWPSMHALLAALRASVRPSRAGLALAGGSVAVVAAVAVTWSVWPRTADDPCAGAAAAMDTLVPPPMIASMSRAVGSKGGDPQLLERVRNRLAEISPQLRAVAIDTCRDGKVDHEVSPALYERSQACLTMRARATAILIDDPALAQADPAAYATRIYAVPTLIPCVDPVALAATAPRTDEPAIAARAILWVADADVQADRYEAALAGARRALEIARPDDRGARALATMVQGNVAFHQDKMAEAAKLLADAYYTGVALDDTDVYLQALALLIELHASEHFEQAAGEPWMRAGTSAVEKDQRRAAGGVLAVLRSLVNAADERGHADQAVVWADQLAAMRPPHPRLELRAEIELAQGQAYAGASRFDDALTHYRAALDGFTATYGPTHPATVEVLSDYGLVLLEANQFAEAAQVAVRVREALAAVPAARSRRRATALLNLGVLLTDHPKQFAEAEAAYRDARATFVAIFGPDHPSVALCDANLAVLENKRGNHAAAAVAFERALAVQIQAYGPEHLVVANTTYNLAAAAILAGDYARAEPAAAQAEALYARLQPGGGTHIFAMTRRARALSGLGQHDAAYELAQRAELMARTTQEGEAGISAVVEMARTMVATDDNLEQAEQALTMARTQYGKFPEAYALSIADVDALLASIKRKKPR